MANEQTSVPLYAASEVLTAANMNISAGTGVPVFATTVTRDAAFGGASEKVLAEGQLCYLSASNIVQYYDGAAWATVGPAAASGLTLISTTTYSAQSTVDITAFTATYDNYKVIVQNTAGSGDLFFRLGNAGTFNATAGVYRWNIQYASYTSSTITGGASSTTATGFIIGNAGFASIVEIYNPFSAVVTGFTYAHSRDDYGFMCGGGATTVTTSFSQMRLYPASGTISGTVRIYGYQNS
jgi:hypothetical protein